MIEFLNRHARDAAFDPDAVRILTAAFDDAWQSLLTSGASYASDDDTKTTREILAKRIIEMAKLGERDQRRLREGALFYLAQSNLRNVPRYGW
jgi:hypothetical protein